MLKALELAGFKSFADRTRFEFPAGITVVVGPNGSGKSNVVDAVKWVLGEQSAKSLRGKEMADVIFKGQGGDTGRKPANSAEATLVFDNADGRMAIDAPEVYITRRVYRSGEGEYLINKRPSRLKDIKDLIRGTGIGADAYSIIEQGRIDRLLQASPKDRRAIFEEAAGISRFKAKKVETQRRLERVDQNLLRLSDIVEEVENRLKSVRAQASKAKRYREYTQRLQLLRTQSAQVDWRRLTEKLTAAEAEIEALRNQTGEAAEKVAAGELRLHDHEASSAAVVELLHALEQRASQLREQISRREGDADHQRERCREIEDATARRRIDLAALTARATDLDGLLGEALAALSSADQTHAALEAKLTEHTATLNRASAEWSELRKATESRRNEQLARVQEAERTAARRLAAEGELQTAVATAKRRQGEIDDAASQVAELQTQADAEQTLEADFVAELAAVQKQIDKLQDELDENRKLLASRQDDWTQLEGRRHGLAGREKFLEEMERTREGLISGVRELLERAEAAASGPLTSVIGVVADVMQARVETAPLIDVALSDAAQFVVVEGALEDVVQLARREVFETRITLVPSRPPAGGDYAAAQRAAGNRLAAWLGMGQPAESAPVPVDEPPAPGEPPREDSGFIGRASECVETEPEYAALVEHLLGRTWLVRTLADALRLHAVAPPGTRFVTEAGEVLEAGGIVVAGPRPTAVGLVSRKSELRAVGEELAVVEKQVSDVQDHLHHLRTLIKEQEEEQRDRIKATDQTRQSLAEVRVLLRSLAERQRKLAQQADVAEHERLQAESLAAARVAEMETLDATQAAAEDAAARLTAAMREDEARLTEIEAARKQATDDVTAARVDIGKSEQRLESLRLRATQYEADQRERREAVARLREQLESGLERRAAFELEILAATAEIATLCLEKEAVARDHAGSLVRRDELAAERTAAADEMQKIRRALKRAEDELHKTELAAEGVRHERQTLSTRLREDYGIEIAELAAAEQNAEESAERQAVEEEIENLRRKINQIGAVNVDALDELDDLESRFQHLSAQHQDLTQAKEALVKIIHKINADSRRLFLETLEAIRANFQVLYRKAFGGGKADITLEDGQDVLEAGVEIMATPPGKPSFNNSLLSGGEKALTAVALLMSIFQFRPSPFCILDEVDAPFDEANIGRFVDVLKEFLGWTRFVIVTHSKKTMTAADTLYGVTMQESGVSKRVSVRFDEVGEDGHISEDAARRADEEVDEEDVERGVA